MSAGAFESRLKELAEADGIRAGVVRGLPFKRYSTVRLRFPVDDDACYVIVELLNKALKADIARFVLDSAKEEFEVAKAERAATAVEGERTVNDEELITRILREVEGYQDTAGFRWVRVTPGTRAVALNGPGGPTVVHLYRYRWPDESETWIGRCSINGIVLYDHQSTAKADCEHEEKVDITTFEAKRRIYLRLNCGAEVLGEPIEAPDLNR